MAARLKTLKHYNIDLTLFPVTISEPTKTMDTLLSIPMLSPTLICLRKEPVLVVGGGLVTDVACFRLRLTAVARIISAFLQL